MDVEEGEMKETRGGEREGEIKIGVKVGETVEEKGSGKKGQ
ncbi:hypothetical protein [Clostridioides difficile]|nr:hypothetical protein [Clostridioides difficile]